MVELAPLSIAAAGAELDRIRSAAGGTPSKSDLEAMYAALLGATAECERAPHALLATATSIAAAADPSVVDAMPPRVRVAVRLLRAAAADAAWSVLVDSATGVVPRSFRLGTSSGAARTEWVLPLLTTVEPPHVYADLPGFRDPRYGVPDSAYDVSDAVRLRCQVDEVICEPGLTLSGWAALDLLHTGPDEQVAVIAVRGDDQVSWPAVRRRRADLVGGSRETLRRRAWAGWSAEVAPKALPSGGEWALWLEVSHAGLSRRARLGRGVSELAAAVVGAVVCDRPRTELVGAVGGWSLQRK